MRDNHGLETISTKMRTINQAPGILSPVEGANQTPADSERPYIGVGGRQILMDNASSQSFLPWD